jgi:general secretion pathway protein F
LQAGLPLDRSLTVLSGLTTEEHVVRCSRPTGPGARRRDLSSAALEAQDGQFPKLYVNMVRAGEASGALDEVLVRLADYLERSAELRGTVTSALVYPIDPAGHRRPVGDHAAGVRGAPVHGAVRRHGRRAAAADAHRRRRRRLVRNWWWALLVVVAVVAVVLERWLQDPDNRRRFDYGVMSMPLFGDLIWKMETARFCHTLSTLLKNGLPLLFGPEPGQGGGRQPPHRRWPRRGRR